MTRSAYARFFAGRTDAAEKGVLGRRALPDGLRIYAFGDIHGQFELLRALYSRVAAELTDDPTARSIEIFVGDYIDRGNRSAEVVDWLATEPAAADERICLMGNHEDMLLQALADPELFPQWMANGAWSTLVSYDVIPPLNSSAKAIGDAHRALLAALPERHLAFFRALPLTADMAPYFFVHAGIRPGRAIDQQAPEDLIWIREPFLSAQADFGRVVVHGHTPVAAPEVRTNRINVDTGAAYGGRLTCAVLEADQVRFMQAGADLPG